MTIQQNIADTLAGASSPLSVLLRDAILIGGIYHLGYRETTIVTNDAYKRQAGGIPQFSFILAAAVDPTQPDRSRIDDDEVVLLRVKDVADLPNQRELIDTKFAAMRDAVDRGQRPTDPSILDPWTQNELQNSGFACEVLGTFFVDGAGGCSFVNFGSDMDNVLFISPVLRLLTVCGRLGVHRVIPRDHRRRVGGRYVTSAHRNRQGPVFLDQAPRCSVRSRPNPRSDPCRGLHFPKDGRARHDASRQIQH